MAARQRPVVVSTRVSEMDRHFLAAAAEAQSISVAELLYRLAVPQARKLAACAAGSDSSESVAVHGLPVGG